MDYDTLEVVFPVESSTAVSGRGGGIQEAGASSNVDQGGERQASYPEAGGKKRASPVCDSLPVFSHLSGVEE